MTRQEALQLIGRLQYNSPQGFLRSLEVLGLLKFEEVDPNKEVYDIIRAHYELPTNIINDLRIRGYKIVRTT
jgi:hypothetical protein